MMPRVDSDDRWAEGMSGDAAISISQSVMRTVIGLWAGPLAGVAENASDALFAKAKDRIQERKIRRFYEECADIVAERIGKFVDSHGGKLPTNEREAAVHAVTETLDRAGVATPSVMDVDLDAARLEQLVEPAASAALEAASLTEAGQHFYRILLRESCAYIVETVRTFPAFHDDFMVTMLQRSTVIMETLTTVLERMPAGRDVDDDQGFARMYRRSVALKFDHLELFGTVLSNETSRRYSLSIAYLGLSTLDLGPAQGIKLPNDRRGTRLEALLARGSRHLLIGEAGSGKTTCMQWLAINAARQSFSQPIGKWNESIPFLVSLRRYATSPLPRPGEFLDEAGRNISEVMPRSWVHQHLRAGRGLLLIDGVDELPDGRRTEALQWLMDLVREFPECRYVVTSRPGAIIDDDWGQLADFNYARLEDMRPEEIRAFVGRWHDAVQHGVRDRAQQERLDGDRNALLALIDSDRHMRALCINPLLCALLCALNREHDRALPRNRMGVYQAALRMLLVLRDERRGVPSDDTGLTYEQKVAVLQDLAFYLFLNGLADAPVEQAVEQVGNAMQQLPASRMQPGELLAALVNRSGLLRHPVEGRVDFIHRTFQEYLVGKAAVEENHIGYLVKHARDDQFREVIVMAAAHAQPRQRVELLHGILSQATARGKETDLKLLLLSCLHIAPQVDPDQRARIEEMAKDLVPPDGVSNIAALAAAGPVVLDLLTERPPLDHGQAFASIRLAAAVGGPDSIRVIAGIAARFQGLDRELVRAWASQVGAREKAAFARDVMTPFGKALPAEKRRLVLDDGSLLMSLPTLTWVEELTLIVPSLTTLMRLPEQPHALHALRIEEHRLTDYVGIERWTRLTHLYIHVGGTWIDINPLLELTGLRFLHLRYLGSSVLDLSFLKRLPCLEKAEIIQPNARTAAQRSRVWLRPTIS